MKHNDQVIIDIIIKDYNIMIDGQDFFDQPVKKIQEHI